MESGPPESDGFEAAWRQRFERFARSYDEEHAVSGWSAQGLAARLAAFTRIFGAALPPADARILDLGCGPGTYGRWLAARGVRVVGLDYSWPSLQQARRRDAARERCAVYAQGDAYHLPFGSAVFDAVVCIGVLQTLGDERPALREMTRVLRPGGMLVLDGLNAWGLPAALRWLPGFRPYPGHAVVRYSPRALSRQLRAQGYAGTRLQPVVILPPRLQGLGEALSRCGAAALPLAHSFFLLARRGVG